jgi:hypothetical protein
MDATLLQETVQIQKEIEYLQKSLGLLQTRVDRLVNHLQNKPDSLVALEGIWSGLDLNFEAIQAAEFQLVEDLI